MINKYCCYTSSCIMRNILHILQKYIYCYYIMANTFSCIKKYLMSLYIVLYNEKYIFMYQEIYIFKYKRNIYLSLYKKI